MAEQLVSSRQAWPSLTEPKKKKSLRKSLPRTEEACSRELHFMFEAQKWKRSQLEITEEESFCGLAIWKADGEVPTMGGGSLKYGLVRSALGGAFDRLLASRRASSRQKCRNAGHVPT
jgi:hypothetical protein